MKLVFSLIATAFIAVSCGGDAQEAAAKMIELKTFKQRISYAMGADHASQLMDPRDPNKDKYDKAEIVKGFGIGLEDPNAFGQACQQTLEQLVGPSRQEFNEQYNKEGSLCIGKVLGNIFVSNWTQQNAYDQFDPEFVKIGFEQALFGNDSLIEKTERVKMVQDFISDISKKMMEVSGSKDKAFFEQVKVMKGIQALPQGMYLETIKKGTGVKPTATDDVSVDYVVMTTNGDTIQAATLAFNLGEVIPGWTVGFPFMQKGGQYRLYVPQEMAYGGNPPDPSIPPYAALIFYVKLHDVGKAGTLAKR